MSTKQTRTVSHEEIQAALAAFRGKGGLVQTLPPQKLAGNRRVGMRHGSFEDPRRDFLGIF